MNWVFSAIVALLFLSVVSLHAAADRENIILTGAVSLYKWEKYKAQPHDLWWLNFVRASRIRIQELRQDLGPDAQITWLVYLPGYKRRSQQEQKDLLPDITSVRDAYNVKLVFFDTTQEVINYLNSGQPRSSVKISDFEYFGHSNRACFMFDYSNYIDSASKVWLHENDLTRINRGIFTADANVKSWGCHTGESMSKKFYAATGTKMWGALGKTQYLTETLPEISTPGGHWAR